MTISKTLIAKANKAGIALAQEGNEFRAGWPQGDKTVIASSAKQALNDMFAVMDAIKNYPAFQTQLNEDGTFYIYIRDSDIEVEGLRPEAALAKAKAMWQEAREDLDISDEESDNEARAEISQEIEEETGEEEPSGVSVVKDTYRAIYKEQGRNGVGSGDWLDHFLANECNSETGKVNLDRFEDICTANGVDLSKYRRSGNGWQGRLRMTGRNLLAKVIKESRELKLPWEVDGQNSVPAPSDWQGFKRYPKAETMVEEAIAEIQQENAQAAE